MKISNLKVETVKKDIKNMHLGVYPPEGKVRVAAPKRMNDESIRLFIISKIPWIKKQKSKFEKQKRQSKREYVSGESHYFLGNRYLLNVIPTKSKEKVEIKNKKIINLYTKSKSTTQKKEKIFNDFYRSELKKQIPSLIKKWENKTQIKVNEVKIKKMKTKWGSCNQKDKRIWLNLELAKKPINHIEYVLIHEMIHLIEKKHSERFYNLMDNHFPSWEHHKNKLNHEILGHFVWKRN